MRWCGRKAVRAWPAVPANSHELPGVASGVSFAGTAGVAQSVEQRTRNAKVAGSIPVSGTILINALPVFRAFFMAPLMPVTGGSPLLQTCGNFDKSLGRRGGVSFIQYRQAHAAFDRRVQRLCDVAASLS